MVEWMKCCYLYTHISERHNFVNMKQRSIAWKCYEIDARRVEQREV